MVLQTLTDINCVGGSRPAIPVSIISFHFIHLTSDPTRGTGRRIFYRMSTLEWEENRIIAYQYLLHTLEETEGSGSQRQLVLGTPFTIIIVKIRLKNWNVPRHGDVTTALLQYDALSCGGSFRTFRKLVLPFSSKAKLHLCRRKHVIMESHLITGSGRENM
jgi:hypothetical protein